MLKFYNFDIVFQEIPDETTLAVNITGCPNRCVDCHSPHLREDIGEPLTEEALRVMYETYSGVTCICFMGGDAQPQAVAELAAFVKRDIGVKSAWYSGAEKLAPGIDVNSFDFIKIGPYVPEFGGLDHKTTNQRLYQILPGGEMKDITFRFHQKGPLGQ